MSKKLEFHPLCEKFPLLGKAELKELANDIKENGQVEDILLLDGKILDGRNRYLACELAKVDPRTAPYKGKTDPASLVKSLNIHRRHLNESQRSMIAADLATLAKGQRKDGDGKAVSEKEAAALTNVSVKSVERARTVKSRGIRRLQKAVRAGKLRVSTASKIARKPRAEQRKLLKRSAKDIREAVAEPRGGLAAEKKELAAVVSNATSAAKQKVLKAFDEWLAKAQAKWAYAEPKPAALAEEVRKVIEDALS